MSDKQIENFDNLFCLSSNPLIKHKITLLRNKRTNCKDFREILEEITLILAVEASRHLKYDEKLVSTPLAEYQGIKIKSSVVVPILRAGMGMLNPFLRLFPDCKVGFIGVARDEETLQPKAYYSNFPKAGSDTIVFLLDPMLATGGSAIAAVKQLKDMDIKDVVLITILSAPEGVAALKKVYPDVIVYSAEVDQCLNDQGFIMPGLGDAGDRIFNTLKI